jgi:hypothetical protein
MKSKFIWITALTCVFLLGFTGFATMQTSSIQKLRLNLDSTKKTYNLGEPTNFLFELKNVGNETVTILDQFGTGTGNLHLEISKDGQNFIGYGDPHWGSLDSSTEILLQPNIVFTASGSVLWSLLNQDTPKFRLTESGTYFVKANYTYVLKGENEEFSIDKKTGEVVRIRIESQPIKIVIEEPKGEDLEVWSRIKDNGNFAYFLKVGEPFIPSYKPEERAKFQAEVEDILNKYPNSFYAEPLRNSLVKFKASEAKRCEMLEKMKAPKP